MLPASPSTQRTGTSVYRSMQLAVSVPTKPSSCARR
jgi:hypothetical protein